MGKLRQIMLTEGQPGASEMMLSLAEYAALSTTGLVNITPTVDSGVFAIRPARKVGSITVGDLQVLVMPKVAVTRLLFLMGYATDPKFWRSNEVLLDSEEELLPAFAEVFARVALSAIEQGLISGYRTVTDTSPVLRGRLLAGEQMTRRFGLAVPLEVQYDEYSVDIAENQLLLAATLRLLRLPMVPDRVRSRLQHLRQALAEVTAPRVGIWPAWNPTRLNSRYHLALRIADMVLSAQSFEQRIGEVLVSGFVFDMWKIYEDFIIAALIEALIPHGGSAYRPASEPSKQYLDTGDRVVLEPDLTWLDDGGAPRVVIDAKYKRERPSGFPNADLYQLVAYCTALGLREGHLVYAQGDDDPHVYPVRGADMTIYCHTIDLELQPGQLLERIDELADRVAR